MPRWRPRQRWSRCLRSWLLAALLCGCGDRALEASRSDLADLGISDLSVAAADLATPDAAPSDLAPPAGSDLGPLRHLGEPCDLDAECLSGDCVTADESRGTFDHVCGQNCGYADQTGIHAEAPCLEGVCLSFDIDVYWCLQTCDAQNHNTECAHGFVCCSGGGQEACVSPAAIACIPL